MTATRLPVAPTQEPNVYLRTPENVEVIWGPNPGPQTAFLASTAREVLMGGAVAGGKSDALVVAPLRFSYHPRHRAILLRREREDLQELIDRMREIYPVVTGGRDTWVETRSRFELPTGAYIQAGTAEREEDIYAYKSFEYNWVGFDELTLWLASQYKYMFSRNRSKDAALPLQIRAGTNPDGEGHEWVFKHFVENREPGRVYEIPQRYVDLVTGQWKTTTTTRQFIPATVFDNPKLTNRDEYIAGLRAMGPHLADALIYGRWDFFRGQMFPYGPTAGLTEVTPEIKSTNHYVVRSLDYGWTDPTVIQWWIVYPALEPKDGLGPVTEICAELHVTETSIPAIARIAREIETRLQSKDHVNMPPRLSMADPSIKKREGSSHGRSILDLFQDQGMWFERANNDRQAGWAQTRLQLEHGRARYWSGRCPYLISTLPKLVRDTKRAEDIKDKQDDHDADTMRYAQVAIRDVPQSEPSETEPRPNQDRVYPQLIAELNALYPTPSFGEPVGDPMDYL